MEQIMHGQTKLFLKFHVAHWPRSSMSLFRWPSFMLNSMLNLVGLVLYGRQRALNSEFPNWGMALAMSQKSSRYLFAAMGLTKRLGFSCPGRSCMHALLPSAGQTSCCQGWQRRQHLHVDHYSPVAPFIESIHSQVAPFIYIAFFWLTFLSLNYRGSDWNSELIQLWGDSWEVATAGRLIIVSPGSLLVLLLLLCLKDVGFEEAFWYKWYSRKTQRWVMREIGGALNLADWIPWECWHYQKAQLDDLWIP